MQIYDSPESDLKLNDVIEFVGIFTVDPDLTTDRDDSEAIDEFCEDALVYMPPSKVNKFISLFPLNIFIFCK